jgi:hypothetical protein
MKKNPAEAGFLTKLRRSSFEASDGAMIDRSQ